MFKITQLLPLVQACHQGPLYSLTHAVRHLDHEMRIIKFYK